MSYTKKSGKPVTVVDLISVPPLLSTEVTVIEGTVLSNAIKSQFCLSLGVWIVGAVTSFTSSGISTGSVVSSKYVTVALIVCVPAFTVLIEDAVTDFTLLFPLLLIVTADFKSLFVTGTFWFLTILVPVGTYSSLNFRTDTVTFTVSFEVSGYVTSTTPVLSPGLEVFGVVFQVYLVPVGKPVVLTLASALGVAK